MEQKYIRIARQFHWEMGHRLPFHRMGCANIHGHSYKLWVEIEGVLDEHGMLMDYGDLKRIVEPVLEPLDHAFMCSEQDEIMKNFLSNNDFKTIHVPFTSTAENIIEYLLLEIWSHVSHNERIHSLRLRLHETDNSYAETGISR